MPVDWFQVEMRNEEMPLDNQRVSRPEPKRAGSQLTPQEEQGRPGPRKPCSGPCLGPATLGLREAGEQRS